MTTQYGYNPAGQTTQVAREGRTTDYGYDGLGRRVTTTDTTTSNNTAGTDTSHTAFNGLAPAQTTSTGTGTTTLVRDALGNLAEHVTQNGQATWDLLDRLGSTIAGANGPAITQLSSYDDWGAQQFATTGWSAPENYTGETTDPTQGLNHYHARTYDPGTASWTTPDPWHGLLTQPQSRHRYAYTQNDPTTYVDINGNRIGDPSSYNGVTPAQAEKMRQVDNQTNQQVAQSVQKSREAAAAPTKPAPPSKPKATGPNSQNNEQARHAEEDRQLRSQLQFLSNVLGLIRGALGFAALFLGPIGAVVAGIASALLGIAGVVLGCLATGIDADCVVNAILALVPVGASAVSVVLRGILKPIVKTAIEAFGALLGGLGGWKSAGGLWPDVRRG